MRRLLSFVIFLLVFPLLGAPPAGAADDHPTAPVCTGDGVSGNRVEVVYAYIDGSPNNEATYALMINDWAAVMDWAFDASAARQVTGASAHPRWLFTAGCGALDIATVKLPSDPGGSFDALVSDFDALGMMSTDHHDRRYFTFVDDSSRTLESTFLGDDNAYPANNASNGNAGSAPQVSYIGGNAWKGQDFNTYPLADYGTTWEDWGKQHELMHTLGAVNASAPHSYFGHVSDCYDAMCGKDTKVAQARCKDDASFDLFDCGADDYFAVRPACRSYLATHWNTYNNSFLARGDTEPLTCAIGGRTRTTDRTPTFKIAADRPATFECKLDGRAPEPCAGRFTTPKLRFGRHTLTAVATDQDGLTDSTPATLTFKVIRRRR